MQKPKSKIQSPRKGGVRTRLFGTRRPQHIRNVRTEPIILLRKPLLQFKIFHLEVIIYRFDQALFERMKGRQ